MNKAGRSILWFLGACLLFTQGTISFVSQAYSSISGGWFLLFGFLALLSVLVTLLIMFFKDPAYITAERSDVVTLSLIQKIARKSNPELLKTLITHIKPSTWIKGEIDAEEEETDAALDVETLEDDVDEGETKDVYEQRDLNEALKTLLNTDK